MPSQKRGRAAPIDWSDVLVVFLCLQVADTITTIVGMRLGLNEASPFIRWLMQSGTVGGLLASKIIALVIAGVCVSLRRFRIIRLANCWYSALVVWNTTCIFQVL